MRPQLLLAALLGLLSNACYSAGDGKPPPLESLYFPTGLALDGNAKTTDDKPKYLYVANSDFDLQYRAGSVLSYDLEALLKFVPQSCNTTADCTGGFICDTPGTSPESAYGASYYCVDPSDPKPCGELAARDEADLLLHPGRCVSMDPMHLPDGTRAKVDSVGIGAFAADVIWRANPNSVSQGRLFVPVRGDSTLHWIDVEDGHFDCGQAGGEDNACNGEHRSGNPGSEELGVLRQPPEPYAIDATADAEYIALSNQTSGSVSLYHNDWTDTGAVDLVNILGGLPLAPVAIAALPKPVLVGNQPAPAPGFLVAYRTAAQIDLLRVHADAQDPTSPSLVDYTRYALLRAGSVPITANSLGFDSRGIAVDDSQRRADYIACLEPTTCMLAPDREQCQNDCLRAAHQPGIYVASRAPASLLVGALTTDLNYPAGTSELPSFTDSLALTFGPSRVIVGDVKVPGTSMQDDAGSYDLERRIFAVCFDSRRIFVYDPKRRRIEAIVSTGRGPYALAMDTARGLAYLGHFTDSYLGLVSLDQRFPKTYATIIASVGAPQAPRSSK